MNKKLGSGSEIKAAKIFQKHGYWAHVFKGDYSGQPVDLVALKFNDNWLVDVKHCDKPYFVLARIEANQWDAMRYAEQCGVQNVGIVINFGDVFYFINYENLEGARKRNTKRLYVMNCEKLENILR